MTTPPVRHGWLKHLIAGLQDDPRAQYKVHMWARRWGRSRVDEQATGSDVLY